MRTLPRLIIPVFLALLALLAPCSSSAQSLEQRVETLENEVKLLKALLQSSRDGSGGGGTAAPDPAKPAGARLDVMITNKRYQETDFRSRIMEDGLYWDSAFTLSGTDRKTRAVKGAMIFTDLFGETKLKIGWTINEPMTPGVPYVEKGSGIKYNQFMDSHKWIRNTELKDLKVKFEIESIIYAD